MAVDSFHHGIEEALTVMKKVYDFIDFIRFISNAACFTEIAQMDLNNIFQWSDLFSQYKLYKIFLHPQLSEII